MSDKILQRYGGRSAADVAGQAGGESGEDAEDFGCFGWSRGIRDRAVSVELRQKAGRILAIPYSFIGKFEFEPASGIVIHCGGGQLVRITGRNLNSEIRPNIRLFQGLARARVSWVQESDRAAALQGDSSVVIVERIEW